MQALDLDGPAARATMLSVMDRASKRTELASFLRVRRSRLAPSSVGLPSGTRRRTPGLRREEVALLAGVGVSWYTWLEQGRDIHVSEGLLERLSQALELDHVERSHLFELAQGRPPPPSPRTEVPSEVVSEALQHVLDAHPHPVVVSTTRWDVVALNPAAEALWGDRRGMNSLCFMFDENARQPRTPDSIAHARNMVARFRYEAGRAADRAPFDELASELAERSPDFRDLWEAHEVVATPEGAKVVNHPAVGDIELDHLVLLHVEPDGRTLRVTIYTPRPGVSAARARSLYSAHVTGRTLDR
ncbi:MAG: transcriptional regulator [Labilithrix sp.]|nr:transcriptional regulator [Labilithrix sp.]